MNKIKPLRSTQLISIGDRIQSGIYNIHSTFDRVVNFTLNGTLVSVVKKEIGAGPLNIVIDELNLYQIHSLEIEKESVILGNQTYHFKDDQIYNSAIDFPTYDAKNIYRNFGLLKNLLTEISHPKSLAFLFDEKRGERFTSEIEKAFVKRIFHGVQLIRRGQLIDGVKLLRGCGFGLTPGGDDFIAGMLLGLNFLQRFSDGNFSKWIEEVYASARGSNIFSETFLKLAKDGRVFEKLKKVLWALNQGDKKEVTECTQNLLAVGASSGADLATGVVMTIQANYPIHLV